MITHWIYPTNEQSAYHLSGTHGETTVSPRNLLDGIEASPDEPDSWILSTGFRTMRPGDAIWVYAAGRHQFICALAQALEVYQDGEIWYVSLLWNVQATRRLMSEPIHRGLDFTQIAQRAALRADETTSAVLNGWLRSSRTRLADLDREPDVDSDEDTRLRVWRAIVQRQGQAIFRDRLLEAYGGCCAITGESVPEVLEAAHITEYFGPQSCVVNNGLLLRADLHLLFDRHLIGVDPKGRLVVSAQLDGTCYANLHGKPVRFPARKSEQPSRRGLAARLKRLK